MRVQKKEKKQRNDEQQVYFTGYTPKAIPQSPIAGCIKRLQDRIWRYIIPTPQAVARLGETLTTA